MSVIKAEQPNITAVVDDLYKPFVAYKSLRSLSVKPDDLFLVYRFFISDLVMKGKLDDDNIDETIRDIIMWFVSNHMTEMEKKFFNELMVNLLDMTGLHKKTTTEETNGDVSEDVIDDDTDDEDYDDIFLDDDEIEDDIDDQSDVMDDDESTDIDITSDDDSIEVDDTDDSDDSSDEEDNFDPHDIDPVAISKCYQCKLMSGEPDNYLCDHYGTSVNYLCSNKFNWEHLCPNFEYQNNKEVNGNG